MARGVTARALMLVSADPDARLRAQVSAGERPRPEYLRLEEMGVVDLLPSPRGTARNGRAVAEHVLAALARAHSYDAILSDSEHVGIPLALALRATAQHPRHVMIGHHLTTPLKTMLFRRLWVNAGISRVVVLSEAQAERAQRSLAIPRSKLSVRPHGIDTDFWSPGGETAQEALVVSPGREHRDFATLAAAIGGLPLRVFMSGHSPHSPHALASMPVQLPAGFWSSFVSYTELRDLYRRAAMVVVPLLPTDFSAGVTAVLEGMAVGKAVIASATGPMSEVIEDGVTGILVPPGDSAAMRAAVLRLVDDPDQRERLGRRARETALRVHSVDAWARAMAEELEVIEVQGRAAA